MEVFGISLPCLGYVVYLMIGSKIAFSGWRQLKRDVNKLGGLELFVLVTAFFLWPSFVGAAIMRKVSL